MKTAELFSRGEECVKPQVPQANIRLVETQEFESKLGDGIKIVKMRG